MSCEHCWDEARRGFSFPENYRATLRAAEAGGSPCCEEDATGNLTENARRLRAGQFWDEATKSDTRTTKSAVAVPSSIPQGDQP